MKKLFQEKINMFNILARIAEAIVGLYILTFLVSELIQGEVSKSWKDITLWVVLFIGGALLLLRAILNVL
jgi:hypothetical protein